MISLLFAMLISMTTSAVNVPKDEARQKAQQFLSARQGSQGNHRAQHSNLQLMDGPVISKQLYVFNIGQQEGFVIVSADDCTGELILGYADSGSIDADNMPDNMRSWLQGYADEISWMQQQGISYDAEAARRSMRSNTIRTYVAPLLTCEWNQDEPYNTYCPKSGSSLCPTGCLATAVAQVMYHQGLKHGTTTTTLAAIPAYTTSTEGLSVTEKAIRTFDWTKMADTYPADEDAEEEVARLMEYVGASVQMDYTASSSGAFRSNIPYALRTYFGYDKDIREAYRNDYLYADWLDLIYNELINNGPVMFAGQTTTGGHAFVIDGYDEEDYFHINWGWGGTSNGVFKLSVCYPSEQGIGGSTSQSGYSSGAGHVLPGIETRNYDNDTGCHPCLHDVNRRNLGD